MFSLLSYDSLLAIYLTLKLAIITTFFLLLLATPLALWLAYANTRIAEFIAALVSIPLVLPPTVLGFYLLVVLSPNGPARAITAHLGVERLAFSFQGLVIASIVYSLPFVVQPIRNAFESIGNRPWEVAATLGASPWRSFWTIALPMARPGLLTGGILGFAHTVGEYGVVQMIGGNIPGTTAVISTTIMSYVEADRMSDANTLSFIMILFSFLVIYAVRILARSGRRLTDG